MGRSLVAVLFIAALLTVGARSSMSGNAAPAPERGSLGDGGGSSGVLTTAIATAAHMSETARLQRLQREAELTAALTAVDAESTAEFAVVVLDRRTAQRYGYRAGERFETASVVKVQIAVAVLLRAAGAGRALTARERSLLDVMIRRSDNDAASELWAEIGGATGIDATNRRLGLTATTPGSGGRWGLTTTSASDQAHLLGTLADPAGPLGAESAAYLTTLMTGVAVGQAWGASAAADTGETVALKNGWLARSTENGRWIVNSVARIADGDTDLILVILSHGSASMGAGVALVEQVATSARRLLSGSA
jgi:beta-lactamase class A